MAAKKVFDGELMTIGAKVPKELMGEINSLMDRLGMGSKSEFLRAAVTEFLRTHSGDGGNVGVNRSVTNWDGTKSEGWPDICRGDKGLEIPLESAPIGIQSTGQVLLSRLRSALLPKGGDMDNKNLLTFPLSKWGFWAIKRK